VTVPELSRNLVQNVTEIPMSWAIWVVLVAGAMAGWKKIVLNATEPAK
jgi:hypothetical protein